MKRILVLIMAVAMVSATAFAQQKTYKASMFGIKSNGVIDNTASIQRAIDFISENGGGTLQFSVGRYLTGAIELKSNVSVKLGEGAVIVGQDNIYAYKGQKGLFYAIDAENVSISGKGVIDGRGPAVKASLADQQAKGYLPADAAVPSLVYFRNCTKSSLKDFILRHPATDDLFVVDGGETEVSGCYTDSQ